MYCNCNVKFLTNQTAAAENDHLDRGKCFFSEPTLT